MIPIIIDQNKLKEKLNKYKKTAEQIVQSYFENKNDNDKDKEKFTKYLGDNKDLLYAATLNQFENFINVIIDENDKDDIKKIFEDLYKKFRQNPQIIDNKVSEIAVCPYCNINYIFDYDDFDGQKKAQAQFDHFYPKDDYPYLSLNFYNLVPCCNVCNAKKAKAKSNFINPYDDKLKNDTYQFRALPVDCFNFEIKIECTVQDNEAIEGLRFLNEKIGLEARYQNFNYVANELFEKAQIFSEYYIESIMQILNKNNSLGMFLWTNLIEFRKMFLVSYIDDSDFLKRSLSKLTKDIAMQFGII